MVDTKHKAFVELGNFSCGLYCGDDKGNPPIFFTTDETLQIEDMILGMSIVSIIFTMLYFYIVLRECQITKQKFCKLPFAYQAPTFISMGYFMIGITFLSPFVFGKDKIICNTDEQSIVNGDTDKFCCLLTAFIVWFGIRVSTLYSTALSISLVLALYRPWWKEKKWIYHIVVFVTISGLLVGIILIQDVTGDYYLGICTTILAKKWTIFWMEIVPLSICIAIFTMSQLLAAWRLCKWRKEAIDYTDRQNDWLLKIQMMDADLRSLQNRVLCYMMLNTIALGTVVGNFWYWYLNRSDWNETAAAVVICEFEKTLENDTNYNACVMRNNRPYQVTYWLFPCCAIVSILGAIIFQCTRRVQKDSFATLSKLKELSHPFHRSSRERESKITSPSTSA